jgi:hypothetical protein
MTKLQEEINRYKEINNYKYIIKEQEIPDVPEPTDGGENLEDPAALPPETPPIEGDETGTEPTLPPAEEAPLDATEELDITDLVNLTHSIKKDIEDSKNNDNGVVRKMDSVFTKLDDIANMVKQMDVIIDKIENLSNKVTEMKPQTPQEKLEMRSLDSYPFNQNPTSFFSQKQDEMKASGKNEYVLTKDDVTNYTDATVKDSFNPENEEDENQF